jgi:hypothetical protein
MKFFILVTSQYAIVVTEQSLFGTGFVIHKNYKHLIMDFHPESDRWCSLAVKGNFLIQQ